MLFGGSERDQPVLTGHGCPIIQVLQVLRWKGRHVLQPLSRASGEDLQQVRHLGFNGLKKQMKSDATSKRYQVAEIALVRLTGGIYEHLKRRERLLGML